MKTPTTRQQAEALTLAANELYEQGRDVEALDLEMEAEKLEA
jgi:hypothetical protein